MNVLIYIDEWKKYIDISHINKIYKVGLYKDEYGIHFKTEYSNDDSEIRIDYEEIKKIIKVDRSIVSYDILRSYDWDENYDENIKQIFEELFETFKTQC